MRLASGQRSLIISAERPTGAELAAARRAAHSLADSGRARVLHVLGADADDNAGDRNYLVLAKPNVSMNDIQLRGLAVAGSEAVLATTLRPLATFDPPSGMRPPAPG